MAPDASGPDRALDLAGGGWAATLLPAEGAAVAALSWRDREVLAPLPRGAGPNGSFAGAFVMAPWANRLDGGWLALPGGRIRAGPVNRPEEDTAIHGLAREHPWRVLSRGAATATLEQVFDATAAAASAASDPPLPWRWRATLALSLGEEGGAVLALSIANAGEATLPFGLGWHPFFRRPAGTRLSLAATALFTRDARRLPVAARPSAGIDGAEEAYEGLDTHFAGWDGLAEILRPDLRLRLEAEGAWSRNLQVFAPSGAELLCVEPVSHVPDAPNRPDIAGFGPMTLLAPGESLGARLVLRASAPDRG
jgi:aldose 1-epimerase